MGKEKPKVAIILPVYNVMPHLPAMLKHLYESTHFPFRLIVVDGFSSDGTVKYLEKLMKQTDNIEIHQIPKKGLVNAINYGIEQAGKLDVYLTQADVIHFRLYGRDWLLEMYDESKKKNVGVIVGMGGGGISGPDFLDGLRWVGTWNTYLPRSTIDKIGLMDEQFSGGDDIDYSYRIGKAKLKGSVINFWVQHHQLTERGLAHTPKHLKEMGKLFKKKWKLDEEDLSTP